MLENYGVVACGTTAILFLLFALLFTVLKERAAALISGFNTFSKEDRKQYDVARVVGDMRNSLLLWAGVLLLGAVLAWLVAPWCGWIAGGIWLILFVRDVHLDPVKAYAKYRLPQGE